MHKRYMNKTPERPRVLLPRIWWGFMPPATSQPATLAQLASWQHRNTTRRSGTRAQRGPFGPSGQVETPRHPPGYKVETRRDAYTGPAVSRGLRTSSRAPPWHRRNGKGEDTHTRACAQPQEHTHPKREVEGRKDTADHKGHAAGANNKAATRGGRQAPKGGRRSQPATSTGRPGTPKARHARHPLHLSAGGPAPKERGRHTPQHKHIPRAYVACHHSPGGELTRPLASTTRG